jgi:hypothetical protein
MIVLVILAILIVKTSLAPSKVPISPVASFQKRKNPCHMKTTFVTDRVLLGHIKDDCPLNKKVTS